MKREKRWRKTEKKEGGEERWRDGMEITGKSSGEKCKEGARDRERM